MAASPDTRLSRKVTKNEEDIRAQGDTLDKIRLLQKQHSAALKGIDETVAGHTETLKRIDATVSAMESHVDDIDTRLTNLGLQTGLVRADLKTVDGRLVRVDRGLSVVDDRLTAFEERHGGMLERQGETLTQHGDMLTEILRRLPA